MGERAAAAPYGGQAVVEGVLMRGARSMTIAVRAPDGRIITDSDTIESPYSATLRGVPFVRGIATLYETFVVGLRGLYWSSRVAAGRMDERLRKRDIAFSAVALSAAAALFIAGPVLLTGWVSRAGGSGWAEVVAEGLLRIGMLVGYVWFIGRLPEVQRVFAYHGAEHRAIHAHEHGLELTVRNVRDFPNAHPRCGTAFLLTVGALSLVLFVALGTPPLWVRLAERAALTPLVASLAYEFLRASQAQQDNAVMRALQKPNLWLQRLTTRDPDDGQIEVAIAALRDLLAFEAALPQPLPEAAMPVEVEAEIDRTER